MEGPIQESNVDNMVRAFADALYTSREENCALCNAWTSITVLAGGGLEGDNRGVRGTFLEDGGLMGAARIRFSPIKPRSIRGNRSAADQLRVLCPFMVTSVRHREPRVVPRRHAFATTYRATGTNADALVESVLRK